MITPADYLRSVHACSVSVQWASQYLTIPAAWAACDRFDWVCWLFYRRAPAAIRAAQLRRVVLRAVRVHAADACSRDGLELQASMLRAIPDGASWSTISDTANNVETRITLEGYEVHDRTWHIVSNAAKAAYLIAHAVYDTGADDADDADADIDTLAAANSANAAMDDADRVVQMYEMKSAWTPG